MLCVGSGQRIPCKRGESQAYYQCAEGRNAGVGGARMCCGCCCYGRVLTMVCVFVVVDLVSKVVANTFHAYMMFDA